MLNTVPNNYLHIGTYQKSIHIYTQIKQLLFNVQIWNNF
jgi:hypothetical protein